MANFCSNCGTKLPQGARFCPGCGQMVPIEIPAPPGATVTISDAPPEGCLEIPAPPGATVTISDAPPGEENAAEEPPPKPKKPARKSPAPRAAKKTEKQPETPAPASGKKPGSRRLSFFLVLVLIVELAVAGFRYPGFLVEERVDPARYWITTPTVSARQTLSPVKATTKAPAQTAVPASTEAPAGPPEAGAFAPADLADALEKAGLADGFSSGWSGDPVAATPGNSPDNPRFIAVSYTQEELDAARRISRTVSRENPEADFAEFGIHVNLKSYNLRSAADVLTVRQLPVKTDPTYGNDLYTYDFTLASGQHTFPCEVEITLPIQGEAAGLRNVLWYDAGTGAWDEVFYRRGEDGKTCTAYIDHFTGVATEEMNPTALRSLGGTLIDLSVHGSVFVEGVGGDNTNRMTTGVSLVDTPDFEKIARRATLSAQGVFTVLNAGGGVPSSAGLTESLDTFGLGSDVITSTVTVGQGLKLLGDGGFAGALAGGVFSAIGTIILNIRLLDMTLRGVSPKKVVEENRVALFSTGVSAIGSLSTLVGYTAVGTVCGWICVGMFAGTASYVLYQKSLDANLPFSIPETLEQNAHSYYAQTVGLPIDVLRDLGVYTVANLYGDGTGWADALNELLQSNKGVLKAEELGEKVLQLYKTYAGYFWTLPAEEQEEYWLEGLKYLDSYQFFWEEIKGMDKLQDAEVQRFLTARAALRLFPDESVVEQYCRLRQMDSQRVERAKSWVMDGIARQTNKIVYDLIDKEFHENVKDARRLLREQVLPLMNTTLVFYADDRSLSSDQYIFESLYYGYNPVTKLSDPARISKMDFICDKKPVFTSANVSTPWWTIAFQPRHSTADLVRCNVYYYLQYGAPRFVRITPPEDSDLQEITGEVVMEAAEPYSKGGEGCWRVPVTFDGRGEGLDVPVVDARMRVYIDDGILEYDAEEIVDTMGEKAAQKLLPRNVNVVILGDGTAAINLPEIRDFRYTPASGGKNYTLSRGALSVTGKVVETEEGEDANCGPYTHYKGVLTGSYALWASWTNSGSGSQTGQRTRMDGTVKYQRDGKTGWFSKFDLYYFPQDEHYEMLLIFVGDMETDMTWRTGNDSHDEDKPGYYEIQLTSLETREADLSGEGGWI